MASRFLKIFKKFDIKDVQGHLLIFGDVSANCSNCQTVNLKFDTRECPYCHTVFKYIAFRNIKDHLPKMLKISEQCPDIIFVDFDDFRRHQAALKAEEFLK